MYTLSDFSNAEFKGKKGRSGRKKYNLKNSLLDHKSFTRTALDGFLVGGVPVAALNIGYREYRKKKK